MSATFSKAKGYEVWQRPKLFYTFNFNEVYRVKLYGYQYTKKGNFYIYQKQSHMRLYSSKTKIKKTWISAKPNEYDQDKSFIIQSAIEYKRKIIRERIDKTQKTIDNIPEYTKQLHEKKAELEKVLQKVSVETYDFELWRKDIIEHSSKPLKISDRIEADGAVTSVHF